VAAKKHHEEGHQNHERWLLTYADLITLLMVFFIVLYATSQTDAARFRAVAAALQRAFNIPVLDGEDATALKGDNGTLPQTITNPTAVPQPGSAGPSQIELIRTSLYQAVLSDLQSYAAAHDLGQDVHVQSRPDGILITLSGELLFASGRADLLPGARELLWVAAARLPGLPNNIIIAGHTDDVPLNTPEFPSNWELSTARALAVLHFLSDQMHIPPQRLAAIGYGPYHPIASNATREGRARNRRVEILIVDPPPQSAPVVASAAEPADPLPPPAPKTKVAHP